MWDKVGMARNEQGLKEAIAEIQAIKEEFWSDVFVPGSDKGLNQELEKAGRVADFIELGELFAKDALNRKESCGGHFREEYQSSEGEALRDDKNFAYVAAWQYKGEGVEPEMHKEQLEFVEVELKTRSYKQGNRELEKQRNRELENQRIRKLENQRIREIDNQITR